MLRLIASFKIPCVHQISVSWFSDSSIHGVKLNVFLVPTQRAVLNNSCEDGDQPMTTERVFLGSKLILSPEIETIIFGGIRHLYHYQIELSVVTLADEESEVVVDCKDFFCPLPKPQWGEIWRQIRFCKEIKIAWKRMMIPVL